MARGDRHRIRRLAAALAALLTMGGKAVAQEALAEELVALEQGGEQAPTTARAFKPFPTSSVLGAPALQRPDTPPPTAEAPPPPFQLRLGVAAEEKATDNAHAASGGAKSDLITTITPSVGARYKTRALDLDLAYELGFDRYAVNRDLDGVRRTGLGVLDAALIERVLFLASRFSVTEQAINPTGPATADGQTTPGNRTRVATFSVTPRFEQRFGSWMVGQLSYRHDEVRYDLSGDSRTSADAVLNGLGSGGVNDSRTDSAKVELRSGEAFSRLLWDYSAQASRQSQGGQILKQDTHDVGVEYRLDDAVGLLGDIGHDSIRGDRIDSAALSGVFYSVGLHWTPSPDTDLRVGVGRRNGDQTLYVLGEHKFSPMTILRVSSKAGITTDAMAAIEALSTVQRDPNGVYVDPFSGRSANPGASLFTRSNAVYRQIVHSAVLSHANARDTLSAILSLAKQTIVGGLTPSRSGLPATGQGTISTTLSLGLEWTRQISPLTALTLNASKDDVIASNAPGGKSQRYRAGVSLNYQMNPQLNAYASYRFVDWRPEIGTRARENMLMVGVKKRF